MKDHITKIKIKGEYYVLGWEVYKSAIKTYEAYIMKTLDPPRQELIESLQSMAEHVAEICELKKDDAKKIKVTGITIVHKHDTRYITITAKKKLATSKSPLIINTPIRSDTGEEPYCMSEKMLSDLQILEDEAWRYIRGERAQQKLSLFDFGDEEDRENRNE